MKRLLIVFFAVIFFGLNKAWTQIDTLHAHFARINAFYDSAEALAFDVKFMYDSDTLLENYQHRETEGTFIMDKDRFYYKLNFSECVQSDSFFIAVMDPEMTILVGEKLQLHSGGIVPLRELIDTLTAHNFNGFSFSINKTDTIHNIQFVRTDSLAMYKKISVYYDSATYALTEYEIVFDYYPGYELEGEGQVEDLVRPVSGPRELRLRIFFQNYRVANITEDLFDLSRYFKDDGSGEWIGVGKYKDYTVNRLLD